MRIKETILPFLGLFSSLSTVFCCALPIILVTFGMGAVFASLSTNFPAIIWLAEKSLYIFVLVIILLSIGGYLIFIKPQSCPVDPKLARICNKTRIFNKWLWFISVIILIISLFFKYILVMFVIIY